MANGIGQIKVRKFRGATQEISIRFDPGRPLVAIYGENGTGKTTLVDAIDAACNGMKGSLEHRSSANLKHLISLGHSASETLVELTCNGQKWIAGVTPKGIVTSGEGSRPQAHVLYRGRLTQFSEATPSERYEQLRRFIDVSGVERSEATLAAALKQAQDKQKEATHGHQQALDALNALWETEGKPGSPAQTATDWARAKVEADQTQLEQQRTKAEYLLTLMHEVDLALQAYQETMRRFKEANAALQSLKNKSNGMPDTQREQSMLTVELLKRVQAYLDTGGKENECPACQQPVERETLQATVRKRLQQMASLVELSSQMEEVVRQADVAKTNTRDGFTRLRQRALQLLETSVEVVPALFKTIQIDADAMRILLQDESRTNADDRRQIVEFAQAVLGTRPQLEKRRDAAARDLHTLNSVLIHLGTVLAHQEAAGMHAHQAQWLEQALQVVRSERLQFTQSVLDQIRDECVRLYSRLHPGERLNFDSLKMDEKRRASLHQFATFEGRSEVPPTAYFSDSHLDTLGICLFIAIAKLSQPENTILVMDDVFTSVDLEHLERVLDLLLEESQSFAQIIVATHLRPWVELMERNPLFSERGQLIRLGEWSAEQGLQVETLRV
jgi:DNA repair exonuclease SbcCD ATPase subunit